MKSNYQGIFGKMLRRTNSASRSARPTAHPSSDSLNLLRLIWLSPFILRNSRQGRQRFAWAEALSPGYLKS
jgi:hypothetical protein